MILTKQDGIVAQTPEQEQALASAGYHQCYGKRKGNRPCNFMISPTAVEQAKTSAGGYYTCPICGQSFDLMEDIPWHGAQEGEGDFSAGGGTRIGLPMQDQAQIGEDLVENLGELPGYGKITWWHQGGATAVSPLDGAVADWGIEVKTLGYDAMHHRFVPGGVRNGYDEKGAKNEDAAKRGLKGVLGLLVLLDYRRSVADIFAREMPLAPWTNGQGKTISGVAAFRSHNAQHLIAEVPFKNPFMDPNDPAPIKQNESAFADREGVGMAF